MSNRKVDAAVFLGVSSDLGADGGLKEWGKASRYEYGQRLRTMLDTPEPDTGVAVDVGVIRTLINEIERFPELTPLTAQARLEGLARESLARESLAKDSESKKGRRGGKD